MIWGEIPEEVRGVFADSDIWWEKGQRSTIKQFLSQYTLHDSYWRSIDFEHGGVLYAVMLFDIQHVDPKRHKLDLPIIGEGRGRPFYTGQWPYLCIRFNGVHQLLSKHSEKYVVDDVVNAASTRILTEEQRSEWLDSILKLSLFSDDVADFLLNEGVHITTFEGTGVNHVHVVHNEPTQFLCVKQDGSFVHLPDLAVPDNTR